MLMNTQMCTQLPMQICVHTLRFAQLLHAKYMHTPTDIWALNPRHPIRVPQLLPCQDPCAAEGVAAGTKAAAFLARSGLAVRATTSYHGHPLPRSSCHHSWCQNALSAPWDCTPAGTLESTAHPQSHSGVLLMENGQTLLGDLGELGLIPVSTCRKQYV